MTVSDVQAHGRRLDDFDPQVRRAALEDLVGGLQSSALQSNINMHFHSFFSFNAEGWSPSHIAWQARQAGLCAAGLCDFDVLDGLEEFLQAGELLALRATVNLETRAFLREYARAEINSPGEPGVTYIMGGGFAAMPQIGSPQTAGLQAFRDSARQRNVELVDRINPHVPDIALDYERDVLPLTPAGVATERHIIRAYVNKSHEVFGTEEATAAYWSELLSKPASDVRAMLGGPAIEEAVRSKLAKQGGVGYAQPSEDTFPRVDDFVAWVLSCRAIPLVTWLDGTTDGEADAQAMLDCLTAKGCAGLNIIPDRNWNYRDESVKALKVAKLEEMVAAADAMGLPINIGTEMNKAGLPFVDDLSGEVLSRFRDSFVRGAQIMVGHSILLRYAGVSYVDCDMPLPRKNEFFAAVGALPPLTNATAKTLADAGEATAFGMIEAAARKGAWS
jgi:hypothetical protein